MQLFVDQLTVIDSTLLHAEHGAMGESWIVDIALEGGLDEQSMVMDFGLVKKRLKQLIDESVDHVLLVPQQSPHLLQLEADSQRVMLQFKDIQSRLWSYECPPQAACLLDTPIISAEALVAHLHTIIASVLPKTVETLHLQLRHEALEPGLYYHYSHGLKKHDGNCQRMLHGHRSKVEIWRDGELAVQEMRDICQRWAHIYLVSEEDIVSQTDRHIISEYHSPQGRFRLAAPRDVVDILPCDSTIEQIAHYLASQLKARHPDTQWRVKAYEGVGKGAIVEV